MFDREEIHKSLELQRRGYNLVRWLGGAMAKGVIQFDRAHDYMDEAGAAEEWIRGHYHNLPPSCTVALDQLPAFARFFATYLTTSFELVEHPRKRVESSCGCYCPICTYIVAAPQLKVRKLVRRDKERARKIKIAALQQLAREHNTELDSRQAETLIDSPDSALDISLIAYGQQLLARVKGVSAGPAVLALWREIAWDKRGAPKKNFELAADDILRAEESIGKRITNPQEARQ